ncbi:DNA-directed RNA polymerase sigma-70 factor [Paractinoplanes abujensis]|uniref:RNA polymerase sigma factor n=1 Tax=Paractinoplanes abujensis TaxID=882441 RepID=A0A7W7CNV0_9ACTN|nr:sigma-70 family RNA polymerase sigma factor [Actinoplanes abujensis]MBB4691992.1 RNA polymerase sigma-70 factor (ECF subfamily) [Actinoplanes abujensis]GID16590.1 DNA-directed RNA polymerase sigma-70 factor [Actinoplanes abujensis]
MQTEPTDRDLWAAVAAGEEGAFGVLFDRHSRAVYNHAFRLCGSWSVAEDITQTTFLIAWRKRGTVDLTYGTALPWLLVVAGNCARTEGRSARRVRALLGRVQPEHHPDPADDVAGRLDDERAMGRVLDAVRRLPRAEREAVALCLWSGIGYPEAAAALGVTEVAVRSRVSRARARLSKLLDPTRTEELR